MASIFICSSCLTQVKENRAGMFSYQNCEACKVGIIFERRDAYLPVICIRWKIRNGLWDFNNYYVTPENVPVALNFGSHVTALCSEYNGIGTESIRQINDKVARFHHALSQPPTDPVGTGKLALSQIRDLLEKEKAQRQRMLDLQEEYKRKQTSMWNYYSATSNSTNYLKSIGAWGKEYQRANRGRKQ